MSQSNAMQDKEEVEFITPPNNLKKAIAKKTKSGGPAIDLEAIERAEQAMDTLTSEFDDWMEQETQRLQQACATVKDAGFTKETHDELFRASHDIKGEAPTFGYPLAAQVADSLCRLLTLSTEYSHIPMMMVEQHVDAIRAIVREKASGTKDGTAHELADLLDKVTEDFLQIENPEGLKELLSGEAPESV